MGADIIPYCIPGIFDCLLHIFSGEIRIFPKGIHDGIRKGID